MFLSGGGLYFWLSSRSLGFHSDGKMCKRVIRILERPKGFQKYHFNAKRIQIGGVLAFVGKARAYAPGLRCIECFFMTSARNSQIHREREVWLRRTVEKGQRLTCVFPSVSLSFLWLCSAVAVCKINRVNHGSIASALSTRFRVRLGRIRLENAFYQNRERILVVVHPGLCSWPYSNHCSIDHKLRVVSCECDGIGAAGTTGKCFADPTTHTGR